MEIKEQLQEWMECTKIRENPIIIYKDCYRVFKLILSLIIGYHGKKTNIDRRHRNTYNRNTKNEKLVELGKKEIKIESIKEFTNLSEEEINLL